MAISTLRKLSELAAQAKTLGLEVIPTKSAKRPDGSYYKTYSKEDYIKALRSHYLQYKSADERVFLDLMLHIDSPMLCQQFKVLKDNEQHDALDKDNNDWIAEEKIDGNRMILMFIDGKFAAFSRNISVEDFLPVPYGDHILLEGVDLSKVKHSIIIDCECVSSNPNVMAQMMTETQLQATSAILALNAEQSLEIQRKDPLIFKVFDVIYIDGHWVTDRPLEKRLGWLEKLYPSLLATGLHFERPRSVRVGKRKFFEEIIDAGGEGVVLKNLKGQYITNGTRQRDGWVKVKRSMSLMAQRNGLDDSIDAFVTGFEPGDESNGFSGMIGSLTFSCFVKREDGTQYKHEIARVANIPLEVRKAMTITGPNGEISLDPSWYGRVASVDGATISARAYRLQHPRLICWRDDKSVDQCVIEEVFLKSQVGTNIVD